MTDNSNYLSASKVLQTVVDNNTADSITFEEIRQSLHGRGFGILMLMFSMPLIFVPPGLTAIAVFPVLMFSVQLIMALDSPWLPKWIRHKSIKRTTLAMMIEKANPILKRVEALLSQRFTSLATTKHGEKIIGLFSLFFSLSIAVPLPATNLIPAIGIAIMSLGLINKDGITICVGMFLGTCGSLFTLSILIYGSEFIYSMLPNF